MEQKFTTMAQEVIGDAIQSASAAGNAQVETLHVMDALLRQENGVIQGLIQAAGGNPQAIGAAVRNALVKMPAASGSTTSQPQASRQLTAALAQAEKEMQQMGALNDALPSLYRLALDTYNSEGDDVVTRIDQLNTQEQNAQAQYNAELSDYYSQLDRKGSAYNAAYEQDYGRYQDYLGRLDTLYGYYSNQEQQAIAKRKQAFNGVLSILGVIGDAVQLAITGTTGIGSLVGTLANTGYNMYAKDRAYAAERADAAWDQQMQETQRQDSLAQQKYKNEQAERQYQDTLRQQEFNNNVTSEKLNIAKGEWALKQSKAAQSAQQAAANAGAKSAGSSGGSGSGSVLSSGGGTIVPYSAARLYRQGRSDTAIRSELLKEGYSNDEVANILKQLGS